tara:strand:- start:105 stop:560 length:456 start_codon:yes stop_codon:yes gene_type:complete
MALRINPEVEGFSLGTRLAVFGKWSEIHGHDSDESPEIINSMKKKNLLYYDDQPIDSDDEENQDDPSTFTAIDNIDYIKYLMEGCPYEYEIGIISISYLYHDRLFSIKHFGIEKFQRKWRDYWKKKQKKIMFMKSIKNLKHREIHGKYPLF